MFTLRDATIDDVDRLARLHVETFIETHGGGPQAPTFELRERQWREIIGKASERDFIVVIEDDDGELIGFARGVPYDGGGGLDFAGELNKIYLLRRFHSQGLGRRLLAAVTQRFLERGITSMLLFGDAANPSNGFYERLGAERLYSPEGEFHGAYGWRDLRALAALCPPE
jgi:GNAT superfamily N-acetyltransferase